MTREIDNAQRIMMTQLLADVMDAVQAIKYDAHNVDTHVDKINSFIPKLKATISLSDTESRERESVVRYFTYLNHKNKGKKRVYVSSTRFRRDIYMFYLSKERIQKLCDDPVDVKWSTAILGNKWVMTVDGYAFKDIYQLINHIITIEASVSRANKPPATGSTVAWDSTSSIMNNIQKYRCFHSDYNILSVVLETYNFDKLCGDIVL